MGYFEDTREVDQYQKTREDGFRNEAIARRDDQLKRLTSMRQAELTRTHMGQGDADANPAAQAIPYSDGQGAAGAGGSGEPSVMDQAARFNQLKTKQPEAPNQSDAESRRLTANREPVQVSNNGNQRLRTPGSWAPLPMNEKQRLAEMRALNPVQPQADQTPAEDARIASKAPIGTPSGAGDFISRIRQAESNGNINAVGPNVPGQGTAKSDMQVMDKTNGDPGFGVRPAQNNSLEERSRVGREYAAAMLSRYGNEQEAAAAYNWGPGNYDRWKASGANPAAMPAETRNYVAKVTGGQPAATQTAQAPTRGGVISNANAATPAQFTPEQFFSAAPQVDQQTKMATLRLQQLREMAAVTRDPGQLAKMQEQAMSLQMGIREAQVYQLAAQASGGNEGALSQLVQMMGNVGVTRTSQGYVMVDPASGRAMSQPMSAGELAKGIYSNVSAQARAQAAESAKKRAEIAMETEGKVAIEGAKNQGAQVLAQQQGDIAREKAFLEQTFKGEDYKVSPGRDGGPTIVTTRTGVFELRPGAAFKGVPGTPTLLDITPKR